MPRPATARRPATASTISAATARVFAPRICHSQSSLARIGQADLGIRVLARAACRPVATRPDAVRLSRRQRYIPSRSHCRTVPGICATPSSRGRPPDFDADVASQRRTRQETGCRRARGAPVQPRQRPVEPGIACDYLAGVGGKRLILLRGDRIALENLVEIFKRTAPAKTASRSCSSPAVSSGRYRSARIAKTGPQSNPAVIAMRLTPVVVIPARIAAWIGAAPRQRGKADACTLRQPCVGMSSTSAAESVRRPQRSCTSGSQRLEFGDGRCRPAT